MYAIRSYYDLHVPGPRPLGEFAQRQQFVDLRAVGGVRQASGPKPVAQGRITSYNVCYTKLLRAGLTLIV